MPDQSRYLASPAPIAARHPLLRAPQLRALETRFAASGLMERAGAAAANWAQRLRRDSADPVLLLAGPGNNGGDALVAARHLHASGIAVQVVLAADPGKLPADAAAAFAALTAAGVTPQAELPAGPFSLLVDGLFGIGLKRAPGGRYAQLLQALQALAGDAQLLALDCPSGLDADRGATPGAAVRATHTLTFIADKPGLHTGDGPDHAGEIIVDRLGIAAADIARHAPGYLNERRNTADDGEDDLARVFRPRAKNSHKGDFGSLGILGGAPGMSGAALLAGRAAIKLGCGRVYLGLPGTLAAPVDFTQPELMLRRPGELIDGSLPLNAIVCGPGLGRSDEAAALLAAVLDSALPLLLDADALSLIAGDANLADSLTARHGASILTPHPGEAARLLGCSPADIGRDRVAAAQQIASRFNACVSLKGCGTVIAAASGDWSINASGNPLLATAGSGDVLAGIAGALLAQGHEVHLALRAAVLLHGLAADAARARGIGIGLTAGELIDDARAIAGTYLLSATRR